MIRKPPQWPPQRLSDYPYVVVRLRCDLCHRAGVFRLARLAAAHGPEIALADLLDWMAQDCQWRRHRRDKQPGKYDVKCRARFPDIDTTHPRPPDLPPGMGGLRVIEGGRPDEAATGDPDAPIPGRKRRAR